jgi:hypothetical protein
MAKAAKRTAKPEASPAPFKPKTPDGEVTVLLVHFPGGNTIHPDVAHWFYETKKQCEQDPRVKRVGVCWLNDTPITMTRNRVIRQALEQGVDYVLMLDNDTIPDEPRPGAEPFWKSSFDFLRALDAPAVIAAPYVGPPPTNNVYAFQWGNRNNYEPEANHALIQYTREEASRLGGIQPAAALATGCMVFDMRVFKLRPEDEGLGLAPLPGLGWAYYEWEHDLYADDKASTEDVALTRDIALYWTEKKIPGAGCYVNWSAWAQHYKSGKFGAPVTLSVEDVGERFGKVRDRALSRGFRTVILQPAAEPCHDSPDTPRPTRKSNRSGRSGSKSSAASSAGRRSGSRKSSG